MSAELVTLPDVKAWIEDLYLALGRIPKAGETVRMADVWYRKVRDYPRHHVKAAFEELSNHEGKYIPQAHKLLDIVRRRFFAAQRAAGEERGVDVCTGCKRKYYYAGFELPSGVVLPRLRCDCPQFDANPRFNTEKALAWVETDPNLVHLQPTRRRHEAA